MASPAAAIGRGDKHYSRWYLDKSRYCRIDHYLQVLRIRPDYARAHNNIGIIHTRTGDIAGAIASFREAVRIDPDYDLARKNLEWVLLMHQKRQ